MTKVETKNKKKDSEEAEEFEIHGGKKDEHKNRRPICEGNYKNNKRQR